MSKEGTRSGSTSIGSSIAGHRVSRLLGSGTLGRVFEVYSPTDQRFAIKLLRTKFSRLGDEVLRQVRQLKEISSPNVVQIYDVAVFNGSPYIVMEMVDGQDLGTRLKNGPLRSVDALTIARHCAMGLQAIWAHGIAHGDVRPKNILVGDYNVAKVVDALLAPPIAGTDGLRGSPEYLAPERLLGTPPDALTDIYAMGVTLYEMLSGDVPFSGSVTEVLDGHAHGEPQPLATSPSVADLVARMIAKDRALRTKTWSDVLTGIGRALEGGNQPPLAKAVMPAIELGDMFDEITDERKEHRGPDVDDIPTSEVPAFLASELEGADKIASDERRATLSAPAALPRTATPFARVSSNPALRAGPKPVSPNAATVVAPTPKAPHGPPPVAHIPVAPMTPAPEMVPLAPVMPVIPIAPMAPARPVVPVVPLAPAVIPVVPVRPTVPTLPDVEDERTMIRPMNAPVPSAEDIGLTLDPIDDES